jgi:hypothetical protein
MTNPRPWSAATTLLVGSLIPSIAGAVALPVKIDAFQGEVVQVSGTVHSGVTPGKAIASGTEVKTGGDGRADLSLHGVPTLGLGNDVNLLLHSMDQDVLRIRVASGALRIDTRTPPKPGGKGRDVRLNAGDLRLRISGAEAWVEVGDRSGQVCVIAGVVEAQQPTGAVRLDTPGQCLRQTGQSSQWTMVPMELLETRVAAAGVQKGVTAAAAPAAPKPPLQIKVLPLPGTMPDVDPAPPPPEPGVAPKPTPPPVVVLQQAPETTALNLKLAPVDVPEVPDAPAPLPVAPAAASTIAMKLPAPLEAPEVPAAPEPLPVTPAPAAPLAMKSLEPADVPVVPDAPVAMAPAPATTVAMKLPEPVEAPEPASAPPPAPVAPPVAAAPVVASKPKPVALPPEPAASPAPAVAAPAAAPASTEVAVAAPASSTSNATSAADDGRRWRVVLGSMPEKEKAEMEAERLNARGWAVEAREYRVGDRRGFRIGFGEFVARQDAQSALEEFLVQYPDAPAWLAKY